MGEVLYRFWGFLKKKQEENQFPSHLPAGLGEFAVINEVIKEINFEKEKKEKLFPSYFGKWCLHVNCKPERCLCCFLS